MGLGPSIKMTTLHHYNCPVTKRLLQDPDVDFCGIIINGVSENYDAKLMTAVQSAQIAGNWETDGAIVAIDGWGNHHVDFVNVIEQLGIRGIPSVGLSYIGQQGRLVCSNPYVSTIVDFNKTESGYESCIVGQNNVTDTDAYKAIELLKVKIRKKMMSHMITKTDLDERFLERRYYHISKVLLSNETAIEKNVLQIDTTITQNIIKEMSEIRDIKVQVIHPKERECFVNSNLDFMPVACKQSGKPGTGITNQLSGVTVMLTGVEDKTGYQPANIGSSEGILNRQIVFGQAGTPGSTDIILHIDVLFQEGEGRTAKGIIAAHKCADKILQSVRDKMAVLLKKDACRKEIFQYTRRPGKPKISLIKIVSGLGNMYDTALFPTQPGTMEGAYLLREKNNTAVGITPLECLDGAVHSLL